MPTGWLLDITDSRPGTGVVLWMKDGSTGRIDTRRVPWRPPFLVDGPRALLGEVERALSEDPRVERVERRVARPSLYDRRPRTLLAVTARRNPERRAIAHAIDARGGYRALTLYDVDLSAPQLYHLAHALYPFAPVTWDGAGVRALTPTVPVDDAPVPLRSVPLAVDFVGGRRPGIVPPDAAIDAVRIGPVRVRAESEAATLLAVVEELRGQDPDVLLTAGGDALDLPRLYGRALALGLGEAAFYLGREPAPFAPDRPARSFSSYGRVLHRAATYPLPGRFHIDGENSFLFGDASLEGMVDAARLSRLSLQSVARLSPGSVFTAMEMAEALALGAHVPWKKNRPEGFKTLERLLGADRGGVIFQPPVGVHDRVEEFDFTSLFPNLMVLHNLSGETLDCRCCPASPHVAPGLGYRSCTRRTGLLPRTIAPLVARRAACKARQGDPDLPAEVRARYGRRAKMLKWILVTSFGYQGYRNARFGRIECHEAINAYARDLLARLLPEARAAGYRVLHGIVDSLWLAPIDPADPPDPARFRARVAARFHLPIGYEGRYRWIVFLPSVAHGLGVPNRYYGCYASGELKLRGVRSRRRDSPPLLRTAEAAVLDRFVAAADADELRAAVPEAVERLDAIAARLRSGTWPAEELVIPRRIGRDPERYTVVTDAVAALRQLAELGVARSAGESVGYVVRDRRARSVRARVTVAERVAEDGRYDPEAYVDLLARGAETLLAPLGFPYERLAGRWGIAPAGRRGPRSPEDVAQRTLPVDGGAVPGPPGGDPRR